MQRAIAARKFYATLSRKIDNAVEIWKATAPDDKPQPIRRETPGDGLLGGPISIHAPWSNERQTDSTD